MESAETGAVTQGGTVEALGGETGTPAGPPTPEQSTATAAPGAPSGLTPAAAIDQILGPGVAPPTPPPTQLDKPDTLSSGDSRDIGEGTSRTQGGGTQRGQHTRQATSHQRRRRGRLRSYVVQDEESVDNPPDSEAAKQRSALDAAGIAKVVEFEEAASRHPDVMPPMHPGYDIESKNGDGDVLRFIEVKSLSGDWGSDGVGLTKTQFEKAWEIGDRYWLYVVEQADKINARISCVPDPARRVDQFLFDDGWREAAEQLASR